MYVVLGATGHIGTAVADALLRAGDAVTVVTRDDAKAAGWRARGADAAVVDVADTDALRKVFRRGRRAFLLNPPAAPDTDTDREERRTADAIVAALDGSGLESAVAVSVYGARPGGRCGDLTVLHEFEQALARQPIPVAVQRGGYYMSNWDMQLEAARAGTLPTMLPADRAIAMVAPADLGAAAARHLREPPSRGLHHVEGPERYSAGDVAAAFARALGHPVALDVVPRDRWIDTYRALGFSDAAAESYAAMTAAAVDEDYPVPEGVERGLTTLDAYIDALVRR